MEKGFNALLGIKREDDMRKGTTRGEDDPINDPGILDEYYFYRGYSREGFLTKKRLMEAGLADLINLLGEKGTASGDELPAIKSLLKK